VELIDYVRIVRRRWLTIFLVLIACVGGAAVATKLTTPKYQASTQLVVNGSSSVSAIDEVTTRELAEERLRANRRDRAGGSSCAESGPGSRRALQPQRVPIGLRVRQRHESFHRNHRDR